MARRSRLSIASDPLRRQNPARFIIDQFPLEQFQQKCEAVLPPKLRKYKWTEYFHGSD
jgi:hypothetical protein